MKGWIKRLSSTFTCINGAQACMVVDQKVDVGIQSPKNGPNPASCRCVPDATNGEPGAVTNGGYWKSKTPTKK